MARKIKFSYENIDEAELSNRLDKRGLYYANVVMWTILFTLPVLILLDFLFLKSEWNQLFLARILFGLASYVVFLFGNKKNWNYITTLKIFLGIQIFLHSAICGLVPFNELLPYFLILSIVILLINTTIFWKPINSLIIILFSFVIIALLFTLKTRIDKYEALISHGGGVYFLVSVVACLIAYNRYEIVYRSTQKNIIIEQAYNRLLDQHEMINDQKFVIDESNRRLKALSDYKQNAVDILLYDFRNFTSSIKGHLESLKGSSDNLNTDQKEIINQIDIGNDKLNYLSEKLAGSTDKEETAVDFHLERLDINKNVERLAVEVADSAQLKHIGMQLHLFTSPIYVNLDNLFLDQVLFKLFTNIIKFSASNSIMTIHTHHSLNKAVIEIINIGELIGSDKLSVLFNNLSDTKNMIDNISHHVTPELGFASAKKVVETMGGTVNYSCDDANKNYFRIEFNSTH